MSAPVILEIQLTAQQHEALRRLADQGILGSTPDEVAEYLIMRELMDMHCALAKLEQRR